MRGLVEALLAEEGERGVEDLPAGGLAAGALRDGARGSVFEHVQILRGRPSRLVKGNLNTFKMRRFLKMPSGIGVWKFSGVRGKMTEC